MEKQQLKRRSMRLKISRLETMMPDVVYPNSTDGKRNKAEISKYSDWKLRDSWNIINWFIKKFYFFFFFTLANFIILFGNKIGCCWTQDPPVLMHFYCVKVTTLSEKITISVADFYLMCAYERTEMTFGDHKPVK